MKNQPIAVIGAGGHAIVVASTLIAAGHQVAGFYDDDPGKWGKKYLDIPVVGPISEMSSSICSHGIIGIGNNQLRKKLAEQIDIDWITVIHPFAWVHPEVPLGAGTIVCAGAIVQPNAKIGAHVILNTKASVDHDCTVGDYVHIAVSHMGGGASAEEGVFLALGSIILPRVRVGAWATVGSGSVVLRDVEPAITVFGVPARPLPTPKENVSSKIVLEQPATAKTPDRQR